ncbi:uncharacterized protein LOC143238270 [Tachypleus tridentatus]|uniref:uncharacterized protein LOC143238270 n=1 Tax=Tachypleus tridentatus TaxID=6853 RepID=UPI003FD54148
MWRTSNVKNHRRPKNKQTKKVLLFDELERKEYLQGFHKRKKERRRKAQEELKQKLKDEKKMIQEKRREMKKQMMMSQCAVPEVEHLFKPVTYDFEKHTVTISTLEDGDLVDYRDQQLGTNKSDDENLGRKELWNSQSGNDQDPVRTSDVKNYLRKNNTAAVKKSSVFKQKNKQQKIKDRKQARKKKNLQQKQHRKRKGNVKRR